MDGPGLLTYLMVRYLCHGRRLLSALSGQLWPRARTSRFANILRPGPISAACPRN